MMANKKKANALLAFIQLSRSNDYSGRANHLYMLLGEKFGAVASSDVINNPEYSEEIDYLIKSGLIEPQREKG